MYERTLDLMDESVFPRESFYAQKKNPKSELTTNIAQQEYENQEIIDYITEEMKDTLGY
jgi:hypothetical protein